MNRLLWLVKAAGLLSHLGKRLYVIWLRSQANVRETRLNIKAHVAVTITKRKGGAA